MLHSQLQSLPLYGIIDCAYVPAAALEETTRALIQGGIRILQLRAKQLDEASIRQIALKLIPICHELGALFILNDYAQMAQEIGADGVHVGQDAGPMNEVKSQAGDSLIIGRSTHSFDQARAALAEGADYIGFGPLYPTGTKPGRASIGLQDIAQAQAEVGEHIPMFCIGGVNADRLPAVLAAGAKRVCVVSWLLQHPEPELAAKHLLSQLT